MTASLPERPALTVEIAGLAGSGKSTLATTICAGSAAARLDGPLRMRDPRHLVHVMHASPRIVSLLAGWVRDGRSPSWTELKLLVYVMEWSRRLGTRPEYRTGETYLDQGPVYALARLGSTERPIAGIDPGGPWWMRAIDIWADTLDAIIWLDAPDAVLRRRVESRAQDHEIKGAGDEVATAFIDRYRAAYETVLSAIGHRGPQVLRYDTSQMTAQQIASDARARMRAYAMRTPPAGPGGERP